MRPRVAIIGNNVASLMLACDAARAGARVAVYACTQSSLTLEPEKAMFFAPVNLSVIRALLTPRALSRQDVLLASQQTLASTCIERMLKWSLNGVPLEISSAAHDASELSRKTKTLARLVPENARFVRLQPGFQLGTNSAVGVITRVQCLDYPMAMRQLRFTAEQRGAVFIPRTAHAIVRESRKHAMEWTVDAASSARAYTHILDMSGVYNQQRETRAVCAMYTCKADTDCARQINGWCRNRPHAWLVTRPRCTLVVYNAPGDGVTVMASLPANGSGSVSVNSGNSSTARRQLMRLLRDRLHDVTNHTHPLREMLVTQKLFKAFTPSLAYTSSRWDVTGAVTPLTMVLDGGSPQQPTLMSVSRWSLQDIPAMQRQLRIMLGRPQLDTR